MADAISSSSASTVWISHPQAKRKSSSALKFFGLASATISVVPTFWSGKAVWRRATFSGSALRASVLTVKALMRTVGTPIWRLRASSTASAVTRPSSTRT